MSGSGALGLQDSWPRALGGLGFGVWGLGFRVQVWGLGFMVLGFGVSDDAFGC